MKGFRQSLNDKMSGDVMKIRCIYGGWTVRFQHTDSHSGPPLVLGLQLNFFRWLTRQISQYIILWFFCFPNKFNQLKQGTLIIVPEQQMDPGTSVALLKENKWHLDEASLFPRPLQHQQSAAGSSAMILMTSVDCWNGDKYSLRG